MAGDLRRAILKELRGASLTIAGGALWICRMDWSIEG